MKWSILHLTADHVPASLPALADVSRRAFARPPWRLRLDHADFLARLAPLPRCSWHAAFLGGAPVGFAVGLVLCETSLAALALPPEAEAVAGDYHLTWRAVLPEHQGRGIGRALVEVRLREAERLGCPRVLGDTADRNAPTRELYRALGFEDYASRPQWVGGTLGSKVFFRKRLSPSGGGHVG